ncbi:hypothetical protein CSH63_33075 [Micromonospora tulbaghiae]|uniref:Uncharacterized protein n=1 Tax=Micromonospora tulbaghiae TaxID=479978 RepID=A0A386WYN8_9ACTN|nr:hypothetical protein [Micromonospora tulbaghiae]AYF31097.1 hypothetical protein CSH63_27390 [Micromonospora tulbaghiae]AYF32189.1 hypothetical protein CSH63_33075 [Micromonospora tulbaghiae]
MRITVSVPTVQAPMLVSNLLGLAGLLGLVVSVGALAGSWWWSVLVGSLLAVGLAWVAHTYAQAAAAKATAGGDGEATLRVAREPRSA